MCVSIQIVKLFFLVLLNIELDILIEVILNLWTALVCMVVLMTIILPHQEHGIFFHLFLSSLISFMSVL